MNNQSDDFLSAFYSESPTQDAHEWDPIYEGPVETVYPESDLENTVFTQSDLKQAGSFSTEQPKHSYFRETCAPSTIFPPNEKCFLAGMQPKMPPSLMVSPLADGNKTERSNSFHVESEIYISLADLFSQDDDPSAEEGNAQQFNCNTSSSKASLTAMALGKKKSRKRAFKKTTPLSEESDSSSSGSSASSSSETEWLSDSQSSDSSSSEIDVVKRSRSGAMQSPMSSAADGYTSSPKRQSTASKLIARRLQFTERRDRGEKTVPSRAINFKKTEGDSSKKSSEAVDESGTEDEFNNVVAIAPISEQLSKLSDEIIPELSLQEYRKLMDLCNSNDPELFLQGVAELSPKIQLLIHRMVAIESKATMETNRVIWSPAEDEILTEIMKNYDSGLPVRRNWVYIAEELEKIHNERHSFKVYPAKNNRSCHQRWTRVLKAKVHRPQSGGSHRKWTQAEDERLIAIVEELKAAMKNRSKRWEISWAEVARKHPAEDISDVTCRTRYKALMKKSKGEARTRGRPPKNKVTPPE